jgi:NADH-quinone oxidoreductase subunit J
MSQIFNLLIKSFQTDPIFLVLATFVFISALFVIYEQKLVRAGIALMLCFASLALIYFSLGAQFVALSQILIYAVGIGLLIIFSIMLLNYSSDEPKKQLEKINWKNIWAFIGCNLLFILMSISFLGLNLFPSQATAEPRIQKLINQVDLARQKAMMVSSTDNLIRFLLSDQILAFELISVLLLVAFVAAIIISRKTHFNEKLN